MVTGTRWKTMYTSIHVCATLNFIFSVAASFKSNIRPMPSLTLWPLTSLLIPPLLVCLTETILKSVVSGSSSTTALSVAGIYEIVHYYTYCTEIVQSIYLFEILNIIYERQKYWHMCIM